MSFWSRLINVFRGDSLSREILEEYEAHVADAVADGLDPSEARRNFGPMLNRLEVSRDFRLIPWLDSVRGDAVFAWRQIRKNPVISLAAILSIGLALGACASAFRLIDALLLRPLPVDHPERLFVLSHDVIETIDGKPLTNDFFAYPIFRQLRAAVKQQAELIAVSYGSRIDLTYGTNTDVEKANQQYVSGWMFSAFGLSPALGRVFTEEDDRTPGAHPYAVLSYGYWQSRFGEDQHVIGRTFHVGNDIYRIIGVAQSPFVGTETGTTTDIFIPAMMMKNNAIERSDYEPFRAFVKLKPGFDRAIVRDRLDAVFHVWLREYAKTFRTISGKEIQAYVNQKLSMNSAGAGVSKLQADYGRPLIVLAILVTVVLVIACLNIANVMFVRAAARSGEMALRISIGAGPGRLVQLVLLEGALLSCAGAVAGGAFAWWSAPLIVKMISSPVAPVQLILSTDWRVLGFCAVVTFAVMLLLCLPTALRVSAAQPVNALKGDTLRSRNRFTYSLIAAQAAFCFLVLFVATLFITGFDRLSKQPLGFSPDHILTLETLTPTPVKAVFWEQVADRLRTLPGVKAVALSEWPLLTGESWNNLVSVTGAPASPLRSYFLSASPAWRQVMEIPLLDGRDFRASDRAPGSAIVNSAFVKEYLGSGASIGKSFDMVTFGGSRLSFRIVGLVADARYRDVREPMRPVAYVPFTAACMRGTFIVRTIGDYPLALATGLRREITRARSDFRVSNIRTQNELVQSHTVRERLLAILASFFGTVALLLAGVGLYGTLNYAVLQRQREIGIRIAIGARPGSIAVHMAGTAFSVVLLGAGVGLVLGMTASRYIESLLFGVKATDVWALGIPGIAILMLAFVASAPAAIRAARIDPATTLRAE
jgi:predicted permease